MSDFEPAIKVAFTEQFPSIKPKGCSFHYATDQLPSEIPEEPEEGGAYRHVRVQQKRKSQLSDSVGGHDLRLKRMRLEVGRGETASLNSKLLEVEFEGREIRKEDVFAFYNQKDGDKLSLEQGQYVMERRLEELQFVVSPSQKSTPRDGNCLPESLFDQAQYVPELAGVVVDAFELRVQVVLSLENSVRDGLLAWPGGDDTMEVDNEVGTQRQWKQRMLRPGVLGVLCS